MKGSISLCKGNDTLYTLADCLKKGIEYFTANKVNTRLCIAKIYNSKGIAVDSIDNSNEYNLYRKHIADSVQSVEAAKIKKQQKALIDDSIKKANEKPVYNMQDVEAQLKQLQSQVDSLKKGSDNYRKDINSIIDEAEKIVSVLEIDSATFDRHKYFGTLDIKDLKKGLNKLLELNKKKVEENRSKTEKQSKKAKNK
jgi:hypothetical protein